MHVLNLLGRICMLENSLSMHSVRRARVYDARGGRSVVFRTQDVSVVVVLYVSERNNALMYDDCRVVLLRCGLDRTEEARTTQGVRGYVRCAAGPGGAPVHSHALRPCGSLSLWETRAAEAQGPPGVGPTTPRRAAAARAWSSYGGTPAGDGDALACASTAQQDPRPRPAYSSRSGSCSALDPWICR